MAMKGGHGHGQNGGGATYNIRRKWNVYLVTVIVMLVFGAAILGIMGIHRVKDRRIFDLMIKDKDHQILSLQLHLQKEREQLQEVKMKNEEMKMKIYNLRAEKTELNGRILEMQSTISSLKDEQKTIELAFEEKQNEAKLLRQVDDQNPRVKNLTEMLTQKEAEIQDLNHRLNITENETTVNQSQDKVGEDRTKRGQLERLENSKENGTDDVEIKKDYETLNSESSTMDNNQSRSSVSEHSGGVKLEMQENSHRGSYRVRGKHGYLRRTKAKRSRAMAKQTEEISNKQDDEEKKQINQDKIEDSTTGLRMQNESVQRYKIDDKFENPGQDVKGKTNLEGYVEENNGDNTEDSPPSINSGREK